jgi:hypothetical protein
MAAFVAESRRWASCWCAHFVSSTRIEFVFFKATTVLGTPVRNISWRLSFLPRRLHPARLLTTPPRLSAQSWCTPPPFVLLGSIASMLILLDAFVLLGVALPIVQGQSPPPTSPPPPQFPPAVPSDQPQRPPPPPAQPPSPLPSSTPSFCGMPTCTEAVWSALTTDAGDTHSCGARIIWLQSSSTGLPQLGKEAACRQVAVEKFPAVCGGCNPVTPLSPSPSPPPPLTPSPLPQPPSAPHSRPPPSPPPPSLPPPRFPPAVPSDQPQRPPPPPAQPPPSPPTPSPPSFCSTPTCTEAVWSALTTDAGSTHSCGSRIIWQQSSNTGSSQLGKEAACRQVAADEFPAVCGGCNPGTPPSPPHLRRCCHCRRCRTFRPQCQAINDISQRRCHHSRRRRRRRPRCRPFAACRLARTLCGAPSQLMRTAPTLAARASSGCRTPAQDRSR